MIFMRWVSFLAIVFLLTGCGQQQTTGTAGATNNSSGNPVTAPVDYLGAVNKAKKTAVKTVDLASVKQAIQLFHAEEDRYPASLNELVTTKYLPQLPEPPRGMKYTYEPSRGEVRIVPQ